MTPASHQPPYHGSLLEITATVFLSHSELTEWSIGYTGIEQRIFKLGIPGDARQLQSYTILMVAAVRDWKYSDGCGNFALYRYVHNDLLVQVSAD